MTAGEWFTGTLIVMLVGLQIGVWVAQAKKRAIQQADGRKRQAYWDGQKAAQDHDRKFLEVYTLEQRITELMDWQEMLERCDQIEHPRWSEGWDSHVAGLQEMLVNQRRAEREELSPVAQSFVEGPDGERIAHREVLTNRKSTIKLTSKYKKKPGPPEPPPPTSGAVTKRARRKT